MYTLIHTYMAVYLTTLEEFTVTSSTNLIYRSQSKDSCIHVVLFIDWDGPRKSYH